MNFWLAIVAAAMAATDVATTAALLVRAYEDGDLRGLDERCESHRRLLLTTALVFLLNMILAVRGRQSRAALRGWLSASVQYCE